MYKTFVLPVCLFFLNIVYVLSCNEAVCASVVTKCQLLRSCMCLSDNYKCHKSCFECLGKYNSECCSCLDFCPKPKDTKLDRQSYVEDFEDAIPGLFQALTEYPDELNRWSVVSFPISLTDVKHDVKFYTLAAGSESHKYSAEANSGSLNCTVMFLKDCQSVNKCRKSCVQMGASSMRWFHDGCCECIGQSCLFHGIDKSRCENCPAKEATLDPENEELYDYGEYDDDYYTDNDLI